MQIPSLLGEWQTGGLVQYLWINQRNEKLKVLVQGYADCVPTRQSAAAEGFWQFRQQCVDNHCQTTGRHHFTTVLRVHFKLLTSDRHMMLHNNWQRLLFCPYLDNAPVLVPASLSVRFWNFFWSASASVWRCLFHSLVLPLWTVVVDPYFVPSKICNPHSDSYSKGTGQCLSSHTFALLWFAWECILHKLHERIVSCNVMDCTTTDL
jgi:hypothetical protein